MIEPRTTRLGIFGDSYGCRVDFPLKDYATWWEMVTKADAFSCSRPGLDQWQIWKVFLDHHHEYDRVVVIRTHWQRFPLQSLPSDPGHMLSSWVNYNQSQNDLNKWAKIGADADLIARTRAANDWVAHCAIDQWLADYQELIIKNIKETRPDALIIPAFGGPHQEHEQSLYGIGYRDYQRFDAYPKQGWQDLRHSHLSQCDHRELASRIDRWLETGEFSLDDWPESTLGSRDDYFYFNEEERY